MVEALMSLVGSTIELLVVKEKNKYRDKWLRLKRDYYEEKNKADPDMAVLDNIEFELFLLSSTVSVEASKQALGVPQG